MPRNAADRKGRRRREHDHEQARGGERREPHEEPSAPEPIAPQGDEQRRGRDAEQARRHHVPDACGVEAAGRQVEREEHADEPHGERAHEGAA
jgi:hypothetical protein